MEKLSQSLLLIILPFFGFSQQDTSNYNVFRHSDYIAEGVIIHVYDSVRLEQESGATKSIDIRVTKVTSGNHDFGLLNSPLRPGDTIRKLTYTCDTDWVSPPWHYVFLFPLHYDSTSQTYSLTDINYCCSRYGNLAQLTNYSDHHLAIDYYSQTFLEVRSYDGCWAVTRKFNMDSSLISIRKEKWSFDDNGNASCEKEWIMTYDAGGRIITKKYKHSKFRELSARQNEWTFRKDGKRRINFRRTHMQYTW